MCSPGRQRGGPDELSLYESVSSRSPGAAAPSRCPPDLFPPDPAKGKDRKDEVNVGIKGERMKEVRRMHSYLPENTESLCY